MHSEVAPLIQLIKRAGITEVFKTYPYSAIHDVVLPVSGRVISLPPLPEDFTKVFVNNEVMAYKKEERGLIIIRGKHVDASTVYRMWPTTPGMPRYFTEARVYVFAANDLKGYWNIYKQLLHARRGVFLCEMTQRGYIEPFKQIVLPRLHQKFYEYMYGKEALEKARSLFVNRDFIVVYGPPGSGKSRFLDVVFSLSEDRELIDQIIVLKEVVSQRYSDYADSIVVFDDIKRADVESVVSWIRAHTSSAAPVFVKAVITVAEEEAYAKLEAAIKADDGLRRRFGGVVRTGHPENPVEAAKLYSELHHIGMPSEDKIKEAKTWADFFHLMMEVRERYETSISP